MEDFYISDSEVLEKGLKRKYQSVVDVMEAGRIKPKNNSNKPYRVTFNQVQPPSKHQNTRRANQD